MTRSVVTGAAGFIGSHLCERLLADGHQVTGIDAFIPYYDRALKEENLSSMLTNPNFQHRELDLRSDSLDGALEGADRIFHLAAMPGLMRSWTDFDLYMTCNLQATQRLLEACREQAIGHFIYCSTSSAYGRTATEDERAKLEPVSPYGITKLAAEHLCRAYEIEHGLPLTTLRLFSVYGPRQRPDMGYNIFIDRILKGEEITIFGDGTSSRTNTFVLDCVEGIALAAERIDLSLGETFNIGGGEEIDVNGVISILEDLTGKPAHVRYGPPRPGDQKRTAANVEKARRRLGYRPETSVRDGLAAQLTWQKQRHDRELSG